MERSSQRVSTQTPMRYRIIAIASLILLSVWGTAFYELDRSQKGLLQQAEIRSQVQARVLGEYSKSNIRRINELLLDLRSQWTGDLAAFAKLVKSRQETWQDLAFQVSVIGRTGMLEFTNLSKPPQATDLSEREHYKVHANHPDTDRLFISEPLKGKVSGKWSVQFTRPLQSHHAFAGVLVVSVSPELFGEFSKTLSLPQGSVTTILSNERKLLSRYPMGEAYLGQPVNFDIAAESQTSDGGTFQRKSSIDGVQRVYGYFQLREYGMTFYVGESVSQVLAPYAAHRRSVLITAIAISALALLLLYQLLRLFEASEWLREELARESTAAKQASRAKSQFLANMSHEIRTPMNAILGMHKLLATTNLTRTQLDYSEKAEGAAKALLGILNDILDLSKIEADKMELDLQPFRVDQVLRDLSVVLSSAASGKPIEVLYDLDPAIPDVLLGDALRLQQILLNLASNGIKFTHRGQVVVRLRRVGANAQRNTVMVEFSVEDSGVGIPPERHAAIFSDFIQAEASTTRKYGGTGLGLSISKRMITLMGGSIQLRSVVDQGSVFFFTLELPVIEEALLHSVAPRPDTALPAQRVLIIDDNPLARDIQARLLEHLHWVVDTAADIDQAMAHVQQHTRDAEPYSCIYIDWLMPDCDGWESLRRIRQWLIENHAPMPRIVIVSSVGREHLAVRSEEEQSWLDSYLVKPVTPAMLIEALHRNESDAPASDQPVQPGSRQLQGMRVLVVDDNLINQQIAQELLEFRGAQVTLASHGQHALDKIDRADTPFDAVLMDIQMPVMDGYAATRAIRSRPSLARLPIIGLTANAMLSDRDACIHAGMNEHIGKPFDLTRLVAVLIQQVAAARGTDGSEFSEGNEVPATRNVSSGPPGEFSDIASEVLDIAGALYRMGGIRSLYVSTASALLQDVRNLTGTLETLCKSANREAARQYLHTLKGTSGTIGLLEISAEAARLERLLNTGETLDALAVQCKYVPTLSARAVRALEQVLEHLTPPAAPPESAENADPAALRSFVENELLPLLDASDLECLNRYASQRHLLSHLPPSCADALEAAMQSLQLADAADACRSFLSDVADQTATAVP